MTQFVEVLLRKVEGGKVRAVFIALAAVSVCYFAFYISSFFRILNTTLLDLSWGDVSWVHQAVFNFLNGRPFQTSVYYYSGEGIVGNAYPYASQFAMHLNLTPYLFSGIYKIFPGLNALYATVIAFNVIGFPLFAFLILKHYRPVGFPLKFAILTALIFSPGFVGLITYKCLFPLYQGVFILALHYAFLKQRKALFSLTAALLVLISEDAALFLFCYSAFLFLTSSVRFYPVFSALLSVGYTLIVSAVLHPIFKMDMITAKGIPADAVVRLGRVLKGQFQFNTPDTVYYLLFAASICAIGLVLFRAAGTARVRTALLMIFVAPASHWFITLVNGGGHHPMPIFAMSVLAAAYLLGTAAQAEPDGTEGYKVLGTAALLLLLLRTGPTVLPPLYSDTAGHPARSSRGGAFMRRMFPDYAALAERSGAAIADNRAVIDAIRRIPSGNSVVYWTNRTAEGFFVNRNDIWRFPSYYDKADYLVVQKNAGASFYEARLSTGPADSCTENSMLNIGEGQSGLTALLRCGSQRSSGAFAAVSPEMVDLLKAELVGKKKLYRVDLESEAVVVLKRRSEYKFPMPVSSVGFGWTANIPAYLAQSR